jgi:hypothetical protein
VVWRANLWRWLLTAGTELRRDESSALRAYEATIEEGLSSFIRVGNALAAIRDGRLYRTTHETFEDYCRSRWKFGRQRAYSLIDAASIAVEMFELSDTPPMVESHAAELANAPKEQRATVWKEAVESAPRKSDGSPKVTASKVRAVIERKRSPAPAAPLINNDRPPTEDLNKLVRSLRAAIECEPETAPSALVRLKDEAARGLYSPATHAPHDAFMALVDLVGTLMERLS